MKEKIIGHGERPIVFQYIYSDGVSFILKDFTLDDISNGNPFDVLSDEPLLKNYRIIAIRQQTGLYDKNGVEIYEGDIVKYNNGKKDIYRLVERGVYTESGGMYYVEYHGYEDISYAEVVGNVYKNADLLSE